MPCLYCTNLYRDQPVGQTMIWLPTSYLKSVWGTSCFSSTFQLLMELLIKTYTPGYKYRWFPIKRPTSGGQMHNQEASVQQTFHLERNSFFYLLVLMVRTWVALNLYFAHSCTKCRFRLLPSVSIVSNHILAYLPRFVAHSPNAWAATLQNCWPDTSNAICTGWTRLAGFLPSIFTIRPCPSCSGAWLSEKVSLLTWVT